jgi:hypothetical protein
MVGESFVACCLLFVACCLLHTKPEMQYRLMLIQAAKGQNMIFSQTLSAGFSSIFILC